MNLEEAMQEADPNPKVTLREFMQVHERVLKLREKMTPEQRTAIRNGKSIEEVIPEHADEFEALVYRLSRWGAEMFGEIPPD